MAMLVIENTHLREVIKHRSVAPYDTFNAYLESGSEKHMLIRDLVYSYMWSKHK